MKAFLKSIVKILDWLSCIIPIFMAEFDAEPPINPITYGMSILGGLIFCTCAVFGGFLIVGMFIYVVASYPIASCSIAFVIGLFIGIGYLRKKLEKN